MFSSRTLRISTVALLGVTLAGGACAKTSKERTRAQASCVKEAAARGAQPATAPAILGVCEDDGLTVVFTMHKQGAAVPLKAGDAWFTLARLVPTGDDGTPERWQSYFNRTETPEASADWPGTKPQIQATTDNAGELEDLGRGVFAYTFATNPLAVTAPVKVAWEPEQVHRVAIEFRGDAEEHDFGNPVYTWTPASGAVTATARKIVSNASCHECHFKLELHGGARESVDQCVLCHNPGTTDAQSGNTVDFKVMIHKIHRWSNGVTSYPDGDYKIFGFRESEHDYTNVHFPQDQRNCRKCHDPAEDETPDADLFLAGGNIAACGACHNQVSFASSVPAGMIAHPGGPVADGTCAACHGPAGKWSVDVSHLTNFVTPNNPTIPKNSAVVAYEVFDVALANATQPTAKFRITLNGTAVNVATPPAYLSLGTSPQLRLVYAAPEGSVQEPIDWNNLGNLQPVGQITGISIKNNVAKFTLNGDGSYTVPAGVLPAVPENVSLWAVAIDGAAQVDLDRNAAFTNAERIAGDSVVVGPDMEGSPRRDVVDTGKCNLCHERLVAHGNNRANNVQMCVACHNPSATDILRRPATVDVGSNGYDDFSAVGVDGLHERSIDFRELIHKLHAGDTLTQEYTVYGFGGSVHTFNEIRFPGRLGNCLTCHLEGTYGLPLADGVLATTRISAAAGVTNATGLQAADDDLNVTPTGAACTGCHDSTAARAHAMVNEVFWSDAIQGQETDSCGVCHGEGAAYDVSLVHPIAELTADVAKYTPDVTKRE